MAAISMEAAVLAAHGAQQGVKIGAPLLHSVTVSSYDSLSTFVFLYQT